VPYQVQAIISKSCSLRSRFSLFRHGHPNEWFTTTRRQPSPNPHLAVTALSESPSCWVCLQARSPLKKLSLCGSYIIIEESILQQPSLFAGLADTSLEPATIWHVPGLRGPIQQKNRSFFAILQGGKLGTPTRHSNFVPRTVAWYGYTCNNVMSIPMPYKKDKL
jgi:hypothetical protein